VAGAAVVVVVAAVVVVAVDVVKIDATTDVGVADVAGSEVATGTAVVTAIEGTVAATVVVAVTSMWSARWLALHATNVELSNRDSNDHRRMARCYVSQIDGRDGKGLDQDDTPLQEGSAKLREEASETTSTAERGSDSERARAPLRVRLTESAEQGSKRKAKSPKRLAS
jgi:hypothetical protein